MPESPDPKLRTPQAPPDVTFYEDALPYAELDVSSNFSFLRGASHADELVNEAAALGYRAIAITDRNTLAGAVRMFDGMRQIAAKGWAPKLIVGARVTLEDAPELLVWPTDRAAYGRLCRLLTLGKRRVGKGEFKLYLHEFLEHSAGLLVAASPTSIDDASANAILAPLRDLRDVLGDRFSLAASLLYGGDDHSRLGQFIDLSRATHVPLVA